MCLFILCCLGSACSLLWAKCKKIGVHWSKHKIVFLYPIFVFSSFLTLNSNNSMNSPLSNIYNILSMYQFWNHKIYKPKRSLKKLTPNNENASMLELFSLGMEVPFQDLDANGKAKESHLMCDGCFKLLPKHLEHETLEMYESLIYHIMLQANFKLWRSIIHMTTLNWNNNFGCHYNKPKSSWRQSASQKFNHDYDLL